MKILICVKTAVASLVLATVAAAWALPPQPISSALVTGPLNNAASTAIGVATTVAPSGGRAAYVVAVEANSSNNLEVIAWQNLLPALFPVGSPQVVQGPGIFGVAITGLDASRVVTADIDTTGNLFIDTWTVGPAGVVQQNGTSTGAGVAYQNVAITTLSSTQVVTAYQQADGTLAVEAWTIGVDGYPTAEKLIGTGDPANQVSVAAVNGNQVVTAINDETGQANVLQVATWGVDSAGVQPLDHVRTTYQVSAVVQSVGVGAGSMFRLRFDLFPFLQVVQAAFTPIINYDNNVEVVNWSISGSGSLTQTNTPIPTATFNDFAVAGCMLPENAAITAYGNDDGLVNVGGASWSAVPNVNGNGINSIAMATAGTGNYSFSGLFDAYFVTAVSAYEGDLADEGPTSLLEIYEYSYPVRGPFAF